MKQDQNSNAVENKNSETENLSAADLTSLLVNGMNQEEATEEQTEEVNEAQTEGLESEESEESEENQNQEETEDFEEEEAEATEASIDFDSLTPEQLQAAAKKAKSRLLQDVGKLRAENRALNAKLEESGKQSLGAKSIPVEKNPFGQLKTLEEIQAKHEKFEETLETTDRLLEEYEDYSAEDVIEVGNQQFTKKQIKQANRNARDAIAKYLPAQAAHLQTLKNYEVVNEQWKEMAKNEVPEIKDEKSEVGKAYVQLVSDPLVKELKEKLPHLGTQIEYILAHAARSKFGGTKNVAQGAGTKLKVKPPATPVSSNASRKEPSQNSKYAEAIKRFEQTGKHQDWAAAQKYK